MFYLCTSHFIQDRFTVPVEVIMRFVFTRGSRARMALRLETIMIPVNVSKSGESI
jgi:hypothetical protein